MPVERGVQSDTSAGEDHQRDDHLINPIAVALLRGGNDSGFRVVISPQRRPILQAKRKRIVGIATIACRASFHSGYLRCKSRHWRVYGLHSIRTNIEPLSAPTSRVLHDQVASSR